MKKALFLTVITSLLLAPTVLAVDRIPTTVLPSGTTVAVPQTAIDHAPPLESITIVHYKKDFTKPEKPGNNKTTSCYGFISGWAKLLAPADILVNPANNSGLSEAEVLAAIQTSEQTWDVRTSASLFDTITATSTANFDATPDGRDEISFDLYPQNGVIAVTRLWGYFSGKPSTRYISQFDILFNTYYQWGNADLNPVLMDLQNIATHELGHTVGLNDIYTSSCSTVTMYGYSTNGETDKRTLEAPDIKGLQTLYGI